MTQVTKSAGFALQARQARVEGQCLRGLLVDIPDLRVIRIIRELGMQFCLLDLEHGLNSLGELRAAIHLAKGLGLGVLVRVSEADVSLAPRILDEGADGLVLAHVRGVDQAASLVARSLYPPRGQRGLDGRIAQLMREESDWVEEVERTNDSILLFAIVEDDEGLANARQIAEVPGLSGLLIGWGDLDFSLGIRKNDAKARVQATQVAQFISQHPTLLTMGFGQPELLTHRPLPPLPSPTLLLAGSIGGALRRGLRDA